MQKWEYKIIDGYSYEFELDELGEEGWELVAAVAGGREAYEGQFEHPAVDAMRVCLYLKRQKS
jgi:hypothetical protein